MVGVNLHLPAGADAFRRPFGDTLLPDGVRAANPAPSNLVAPIGLSSAATAGAAAAFVAPRAVRVAGVPAGPERDRVRPAAFTAARACLPVIAAEVARPARARRGTGP